MPNQVQIAIQSLSREALEPVAASVATCPTVCPVCDAPGPFEHVRKSFLCSSGRHVFAVDASGVLLRWWARG